MGKKKLRERESIGQLGPQQEKEKEGKEGGIDEKWVGRRGRRKESLHACSPLQCLREEKSLQPTKWIF